MNTDKNIINADLMCDVLGIYAITDKAYDYLTTFWWAWCIDLQFSYRYNHKRLYANCDDIVKSALLNWFMDETETSDNIKL